MYVFAKNNHKTITQEGKTLYLRVFSSLVLGSWSFVISSTATPTNPVLPQALTADPGMLLGCYSFNNEINPIAPTVFRWI